MFVRVLDPPGNSHDDLITTVRVAMADLGVEGVVDVVTDAAVAARYGPFEAPALVLSERVVLSGRIPKTSEVKALLTADDVG